MILLALLLAAADAGTGVAEATPLSLDVQVAPEPFTLGETITVQIAVEHDARDVYALDTFDPAPMGVPPNEPPPAVKRETLQGKARTTILLHLADYGTVTPKLPDFTLHVTGPEGPRVVNVRGRPLKLKSLVESEGQGAPDQAHHGPKPPVPVLVRSYLWLWLLLGLAALGGGAYWYWRWLKKQRELASQKPVVVIEYDEEALNRLADLKKRQPWKHGHGRAYIFELSEIVRRYLGKRLEFDALDLTSEEFLAALHKRRMLGLDLGEVEAEVRWEDMVKFAKVEPTEEECWKALARAEIVVRQTRPLRTQPQEKGAAA
jgi:hypothetical protein